MISSHSASSVPPRESRCFHLGRSSQAASWMASKATRTTLGGVSQRRHGRPRPLDLRSELGRGAAVHHVAGQAGHSPTMTLTRYGHVIAEHDSRERIDAEAEIRRAREGCAQNVRRTGTNG